MNAQLKSGIGKIAAGAGAIAILAGAGAASAEPYHHGGYDRHHDGSGAAVAAGIAGLAIGAALASSSDHDGYYDGRYYAPRTVYYGPRYRYGAYYGYRPYRHCWTQRSYEPWDGDYTVRRVCRTY